MKQWFNCRATYMEQNEEGILKKVTRSYLIDAVSFTEAEAKLFEFLEVAVVEGGDLIMSGAKRTKIQEVIGEVSETKWFDAKIVYIGLDEGTGKEKKVTVPVLIAGETVKEVCETLETEYSNMLVPYEITEVSLSSIVEVIPHTVEEEVKENSTLELTQ